MKEVLHSKFVLSEIFEVHELDARGPFTLVGEQVDGAFVLDGIGIMLKIKWHKDMISSEPVIYFGSKILRRLDNTLGFLF